jgi:hypothetical protein
VFEIRRFVNDENRGRWTLAAVSLGLYFSRPGVHESSFALVPGMLLGGIGMPSVMAR